ncbi:hypothetical protein [Accumulibacter sp.]|uniref:hypothetical protein n=1 Tax=Candidatus Accumulibacter TaxID=327159 RepID=UPI0019022D73|nr:hypothetical protein [Accumulibacter sp.]MBN8497406.1 hypothetical protein [Accumulibacter sp.]MBO3715349.1 hypothetical protein [Accumulibacter sp.]
MITFNLPETFLARLQPQLSPTDAGPQPSMSHRAQQAGAPLAAKPSSSAENAASATAARTVASKDKHGKAVSR